MIELRAIDAVPVRLPDGRTLHFRMTWAAIRRASQALGKSASELIKSEQLDIDDAIRLIYESMQERDQISFEEFCETITAANLGDLARLAQLLSGRDEQGNGLSASG
jgi:hypothetical protein